MPRREKKGSGPFSASTAQKVPDPFSLRAVGGTIYRTRHRKDEVVNAHTWNQVYMPRIGWVDIDATSDDARDGHHTFHSVGRRSSRYIITFIGEYDRLNWKDVFTQRGWHRAWRWRSLESGHRADVKALPLETTSQPIPSKP